MLSVAFEVVRAVTVAGEFLEDTIKNLSTAIINAYSQDIIKSRMNNFRFGKATVVEKYLDFYHNIMSCNCEET